MKTKIVESVGAGLAESITLATPLTLARGKTIKNRFFKAAMGEQLADRQQNATPQLANLYRSWANSGAGVVVSGAILVDRRFLAEPKNTVLDGTSNMEAIRRWTTAGKENDTRFWAQLVHPGKQVAALMHPEPVAPSAIPLNIKGFNLPRALSQVEILQLIEMFATSAELAKEGGFEGVQIHSAHGYLCNQFLSPLHNQRTDEWGGSLNNRMRFVREIYKAIRQKVGDDFPVSIKLNSADFQRGGFTEEESMQVAVKLAEDGIDLIEVSGGTYESLVMVEGQAEEVKESTKAREAYFIDYANKVRELTDVPLVVTGGFRTAQGMSEALKSGATDMVGIGRPMCIDLDLPNKVLADEAYEIRIPKKISTGVNFLDEMAMLDITWYENQLIRIGNNKRPLPSMSPWSSLFKTLLSLGVYAFQKRRA
jgi:2,4-dienoyl-CoA reductase-like NADH-dependent reductase (Old Yellow Enzyme family)